MKTYTTKQGDMWDLIAYQELGDEKHTEALLLENLTYWSYLTFPAGIVLKLPEVEQNIPASVPPWKR